MVGRTTCLLNPQRIQTRMGVPHMTTPTKRLRPGNGFHALPRQGKPDLFYINSILATLWSEP